MVEAWETRSLSEARVGRGKQDGCLQQCPEVPLLADWVPLLADWHGSWS